MNAPKLTDEQVAQLQERVKRWDDVLLEKANRHQAERDAAEAEAARLRETVRRIEELARDMLAIIGGVR